MSDLGAGAGVGSDDVVVAGSAGAADLVWPGVEVVPADVLGALGAGVLVVGVVGVSLVVPGAGEDLSVVVDEPVEGDEPVLLPEPLPTLGTLGRAAGGAPLEDEEDVVVAGAGVATAGAGAAGALGVDALEPRLPSTRWESGEELLRLPPDDGRGPVARGTVTVAPGAPVSGTAAAAVSGKPAAAPDGPGVVSDRVSGLETASGSSGLTPGSVGDATGTSTFAAESPPPPETGQRS